MQIEVIVTKEKQESESRLVKTPVHDCWKELFLPQLSNSARFSSRVIGSDSKSLEPPSLDGQKGTTMAEFVGLSFTLRQT